MEELKGERNLIPRIFLAHGPFRSEQPRKRLFITDKYLMSCLRSEFNIRITKPRLSQWVDNQLLEVAGGLFTIDSLWRIKLLQESSIEERKDYTLHHLQQIFTYASIKTNQIIAKGFYQKTWTPLSKATAQIKRFIGQHNPLKVCLEHEDDVKDIESGVQELKDVVHKFEADGWDSLSDTQKELMHIWILDRQLDEEWQIYDFMQEFSRMVGKGYSPQVVLFKNGAYKFDNIDWVSTLENMKECEYFDFLDTPQFGVYYSGKSINITIKNPSVVNAKGIRKVEQIYTKLSSIDREKKGWGENSGRRIKIEQRDKELIRLHKTLFKNGKYPNSLDSFIDEVLVPYAEKVGLPLKPEGFMKVIHKKK